MARELRPGSTTCITHKHTPQYSGRGAAPAACPCVHAARRASARDWRQQRRLHPSAGAARQQLRSPPLSRGEDLGSALGISVECCGSWQLASGEGKWDEASAKAALQQDGPGGRARGCSQPAIFAAAAAAAAAAARDAGPAVRGPASSEHGLQRRARRSLSSYGGAGGRGRGTGGGGGGGGPVAARRRRRHAPGPLPLPAHTRADRRVRAGTRAHTRGRTSAEKAAVAAAARQTPAGRWAREEPGAAGAARPPRDQYGARGQPPPPPPRPRPPPCPPVGRPPVPAAAAPRRQRRRHRSRRHPAPPSTTPLRGVAPPRAQCYALAG
ncbi:spidroin-2-like [Schistocerca nitens]|uniref:spidroin-2-like n=1 Tax=Schistocerca nitens TaxID=7011 RepID=UPI00211919F0|nr:spidroin-2-like [Schistocerca nitens]